ncbi:330de45e-882c-4663-b957-f15585c38aee [Sclerotinia trifoliorum]|uniref:330de45e-882c-4663-b957-f15585c38aee n=1 Tax=Sclerotinia trifoliorum TaxID=28548 RepID=A0A8H2ZNZ9_9HELO|nr:330de45e-882c-4663-b957-f15585c38aee [Sclerotinia trifoliorum]
MQKILNPKDCDNDFHSSVVPEFQNSSLLSQSAMFATQVSNRISEPGKDKIDASRAQAPDILRVLQGNQQPAVESANTSPQLNEPGLPLDSPISTSAARPLSSMSNSSATNSDGGNDLGNSKHAHVPSSPLERSIDQEEVGSERILDYKKPSATNAALTALGSSNGRRHQGVPANEIYPFQENLAFIPRPYALISKEQRDILERANSWVSPSENHGSLPPLLPGLLQANLLAFHEKRLGRQESIHCKNTVQSSEEPNLDTDQNTVGTRDSEDGDTTHHGNDILEDSNKDAEEVAYTPELLNFHKSHDSEEDHQSDSDSSDMSELSCPSPEVNSMPRQDMAVNAAPDQSLDQAHSVTQPSSTIDNGATIPSADDSNAPTSDVLRKNISQSPPVISKSIRTSDVKIRLPTTSTFDLPSSPSDDEEIELDHAHVLGEEINSSDPPVDEYLPISQPTLPIIAGHKSGVQVEKTPKRRKRSNEELSSNAIIPGTYNSSQKDPDNKSSFIPESGIFSLHSPRKLPSKIVESFIEVHQDKHERNHSDIQQSRAQQISSRSNDDMIYQNASGSQPYLHLQISNLDGAASDVLPPIVGRSPTNHSPSNQNSFEQGHDRGIFAKRRRITDPVALGFSQEEPPYRDRNEMVRANRREIRKALQSLAPTEDSQKVDDNVENNPQSRASAEVPRTIHDRNKNDLPCTVTIEQTSASHNSRPTDHSTYALITLDDHDMSNGSLLPSGAQSNSEKVHQSTSLFEEYCAAYPRYTGTKKQFLQALIYLEWLGTPIRQPHRSLWDDFVRFYAHEYSEHVRTSAARMTGIQFYNSLGISDPEFTHCDDITCRIINPESIKAALSSESPDHDAIEEMRGKYRGIARPASQQSIEPVRQSSSPSELITITNTGDAPVSASAQPENITSKRPFETAGQSPSLSNPEAMPAGRGKRWTFAERGISRDSAAQDPSPPRTGVPASQPNASEVYETVATSTEDMKGPRKATPRRFFETLSQLPSSVSQGSPPRISSPSAQRLALPIVSFKAPNNSSSKHTRRAEPESPAQEKAPHIMNETVTSIECKPQGLSLKPSLERSISPPPSRKKSTATSNKPEKVIHWLKNQEQAMRIAKSTKSPSIAQTYKGKWEFGKYLARKRIESSNHPPRLTPRTSFSLKPRSPSGSNASSI